MAETPLFNVRLDAHLRGVVRDRAAEWGVSESEAVRIVLRQVAAPPQSQLIEAKARSAEVLEREATVV